MIENERVKTRKKIGKREKRKMKTDKTTVIIAYITKLL